MTKLPESPRKRPWVLIVTGALAAGAAAASIALAVPTALHGKQVAGTPTANAADVTAVKAERKAAADAQNLAMLQAQIRADMDDYFRDPANSMGARIRVVRVSLIQTGDNTFEGVATMTANGGPERDIPVHVKADARNMMWNTDAGALAPLFR